MDGNWAGRSAGWSPAGTRSVADGPSFFSELKRRNVVRAGLLYAGAVWALSQGVSQLSPALGLPDDATRWFLIACAAGFPFWVTFAWFYEFTPHGFRRDHEIAADAPVRHVNARRLDYGIIAVLAVAVVLLASGYAVRRRAAVAGGGQRGSASPASAAFDPPPDSLAVLPFVDLGGDPKQQYFSDGVTEELTDALGQNPGLRVIAWETASKLRDSTQSPREIGKQLNVASVLHGSIQRHGDEVRIRVELVDTRTGVQLWSHRYDDTFAQLFRVQDEVSEAIAGALKITFAQRDVPRGGTGDAAAHDLVLKGRALARRANGVSLAQARRDFERATAIDPDYADAHALLAHTLYTLTQVSTLQLQAALPRIREEAQTALVLDPHNADAWVALGIADNNSNPPNPAAARADFRKALELDPNNAAAHVDYGNVLPLQGDLAEDEKAVALDPADAIAWNNLATSNQDLAQWRQMAAAAGKLIKLDPGDVDGAFYLAFASRQLGRPDQAAAAFDLVKPAAPLDRQQVDAGRLVYHALVDPASRPQALAALAGLAGHTADRDVTGNLIQMYLALGETAPALQLLQAECPADPVGCSDLAVNAMYVDLRGNPAFDALAKRYTTVSVQ